MLRWAIIFAVLALILWILGLTGAASFLGGLAQILLWIFLILFVISLILHFVRGRGL